MVGVSAGRVLVTQAQGLVGTHVCKALLEAGFWVRALVPDPSTHKAHLLSMVGEMDESVHGRVEVVKGNEREDDALDDACAECVAIVHCGVDDEIDQGQEGFSDEAHQQKIASSVLDGTKNLLDAAERASNIVRVVYVSSVAAVQQPQGKPDDFVFTESDWNTWSAPNKGDGYGYAAAASEMVCLERAQGAQFDVVVINKPYVLGPVLCGFHVSSAVHMLKQLIVGQPFKQTNCSFVDVRDVAAAVVSALPRKKAAGKRFIVCMDEPPLSSHAVAAIAQPRFADFVLDDPQPLPQRSSGGGWMLSKLFQSGSAFDVAMASRFMRFSNARAKEILEVTVRPLSATVHDTIESLVNLHLVAPRFRMLLAGRIAMIVGCESPVGFECVRGLLRRGANVVATHSDLASGDLLAKLAKETASEHSWLLPVHTNLGDPSSIAAAFDTLTSKGIEHIDVCIVAEHVGPFPPSSKPAEQPPVSPSMVLAVDRGEMQAAMTYNVAGLAGFLQRAVLLMMNSPVKIAVHVSSAPLPPPAAPKSFFSFSGQPAQAPAPPVAGGTYVAQLCTRRMYQAAAKACMRCFGEDLGAAGYVFVCVECASLNPQAPNQADEARELEVRVSTMIGTMCNLSRQESGRCMDVEGNDKAW